MFLVSVVPGFTSSCARLVPWPDYGLLSQIGLDVRVTHYGRVGHSRHLPSLGEALDVASTLRERDVFYA
jgi:hypothetical protein